MEQLRFFDCNNLIGARRRVMHPGSYYDFAEYNKKMSYYGIEKAMVCHAAACEYSPMEGNFALIELIKDYPNLLPFWVALPHHTEEFPNPKELNAMMAENHVRAITLLPRDNNHGIDDWVCGELFSMLAECRVPLVISYEQISFRDLHMVLTDYPYMPVILTNLHYNCARNLYPLLKKFPQLFIETIGFKVHGGIEDVCAKFGAERLIFGTCAPVYAGSGAVGMITYARIDHDEKQLIASGNLEQILSGVRL